MVLCIQDFGYGIEKDLCEWIFEFFFFIKVFGEGFGFGLSVVYGIVKIYGGQIEFESQFGEGVCFILCFFLIFVV